MPFPESDPALWPVQPRGRLDELIDEYRALLHDCVNGLSEEEARMRLVPSKTTLLGLLKHVTYVEGVWFDQAVTGRPYQEIGIATTPDRSFTLATSDTVASIQEAHRHRCAASRVAMRELALDAEVEGRGKRTVWGPVSAGAPRARPACRTCRHSARTSSRPTHHVTVDGRGSRDIRRISISSRGHGMLTNLKSRAIAPCRRTPRPAGGPTPRRGNDLGRGRVGAAACQP